MPLKYELKPSELRRLCDPKIFDFRSTARIKPLDKVIGQPRAVQAIDFGLNMNSAGYHVFVTGVAGTGKSTIALDIANAHAKGLAIPQDWCLVNNFKDEFRPCALALPPGKGVLLRKKMRRAVNELQSDLPKALESESYLKQLSAIKEKYGARQRRLIEKLETYAARRDLQIDTSRKEFHVFPVMDGKPLTPEAYQGLPVADRRRIEDNVLQARAEYESTARRIDKIKQALNAEIETLMDQTAKAAVVARLNPIREEFKSHEEILAHLDAVQEHIVENFNIFIPDDKPEEIPSSGPWATAAKSAFLPYQVNVLVNREGARGAPVVFEANPTYYNLLGRIEKRAYIGGANTDFTLIQAGSLLEANGGFLIMEIEPVLMNPFVWDALKRALQNKSLVIEDIAEETGFGTTSLRPEPIPLDVKVILLGSYEAFELLQNNDPKFNKIFKVRADFDQEVERTPETVQLYARFITRVCKEENLLPFTPSGVAAIVEYGEKLVSDQNKLSLRFGQLLGVLKEADYWARKRRSRLVSDKYVVKAFREHRFRNNLYEQKIHESYQDESILVDVEGAVVGQVNALAVHQIGEFSFGRPVRITAETYMGKEGVISIERESELSGNTHDKGVLILSGYLGRIFAQNHPLSVSISITFEQSYGGIDGDSASSTELYAILSSLAGVPIRQGIAVTGSVNQKGRIQAIGDVNQKVEGFFEICREKGLTGEQGVVIPRSNVKNLMLRREVIDAVRNRKFHVYAVAAVEEGIHILTGITAGQADREGMFPDNTVYGKVQRKLDHYLEQTLKLKQKP
jgi:lon-related putative ATP-dependent protease